MMGIPVPAIGSGRTGPHPDSGAHRARWFLAFVALYTATCLVVVVLGVGATPGPAFYAPVGVSAGAVARSRGRWRLAYLATSFIGVAAVRYMIGTPLAVSAAFATGTVVDIWVFAILAAWWPEVRRLNDVRSVLRFMAAASTAVLGGAVVAVPALITLRSAEPLIAVWLLQAGGHLLAMLAAVPLVMLGAAPFRRLTKRQVAELAGVIVGLLAAVWVGFDSRWSFTYIPVIIALLGVFRLGTPAAMVLPLLLTPLVIGQTRLGFGAFAHLPGGEPEQRLAVYAYGLTAVVGCWLIAALQSERGAALAILTTANAGLERRVAERTAVLARAVRDARLVADVAHQLAALGQGGDLVLSAIADVMARTLGDVCVVSRMSTSGRVAVPVAVRSPDGPLQAAVAATWLSLHQTADGVGLTGRVLATGRAIRLDGGPEVLAAASQPAVRPLLSAHGLHGALVAPMHAGVGIVGVLTLLRGPTGSDFDDADGALVQDLADRIGLALANARLHRDLQDSERRFRAAFDDGPVGMAVVCLEPERAGEFLRVNPALCELTGYPPELLVGMNDRQLTHPDDLAIDDALARSMVDGVSRHYLRERRLVRADGQVIWTRVSASVAAGDGMRYVISHMQDITASKTAEEELARRALHDPLTGLANRHLLMDHLDLALTRLERHPGRVAVLYLDLDRFKSINDSLGHDAGDRVLAEIGVRLGTVLRAQDTPARLGGDEFVVACPDMGDDDSARRLASRLVDAVRAPIRLGNRTVHPHTSIGVAITDTATMDAATLVRQADIAMYAAKRLGRDRVELYEAAHERRERRREAVEEDLHAALAGGWFRLFYQPIVDLADGTIVGTEALLRLAHPDRGLLSPDAFIDVAEDSDLITPIEEWVLREACRQLAAWHHIRPLEMSVNISGHQVTPHTLGRRVRDAVHDAGVDLTSLCLEVTERVLIGVEDAVLDELDLLAAMGVQIAIDDFGTGYSSLAYLQRLPVGTLKIDKTFVAGLSTAPRDQAIVSAVTALAQSLNMTVIAEGIENEHQLDELRRLNCHRGQGFHLARPRGGDDITELLRRPAALPHT
jgi:diguanylate cyclase (GGDEF)-like protein/PAS domain S-box-containing protein